MSKFVTYTRVSTKKQGKEGLGMKSQEAILDHYLQGKEIVKRFTEVGSAKDIEGRPELQKALDLCVKQGYTLSVAKLDRLSRRTEDALSIWSQLDGKLLSCDIPQDNGRMDKFTLTIFMAIADRERELIGIRTRAALKAKKEAKELGRHPHQKEHYLTNDQRKRGRETSKKKAIQGYRPQYEYIKMLREKEGLSLRAIATRLNETDNKTRTGGKFYASTVKNILDRGEEEE